MVNRGWAKLAGQVYLNLSTGDVEVRYGEGGWHKTDLGNIKGTKVYDAVISTYGTKDGKKIRERAAIAIMKSISY